MTTGPPSARLDLAGETVELLAPGGVWWAPGDALFVADLHLGKAAAFRRFGIPAPEASTDQTLDRLDGLLDRTRAARLVVLGDLFHARLGMTPVVMDRLAAWRAARPGLEIALVRGNHDRRSGDPPADLGVRAEDPGATLGPWRLAHEPDLPPDPGAFTLAGHVHPAVRLRDAAGRASPRFPCFHVSGRTMVLPALGAFTGARLVRPAPGDRVVALIEGEAIDVTAAAAPR
jgi:DNA ligase-associated metallophosphoesterase